MSAPKFHTIGGNWEIVNAPDDAAAGNFITVTKANGTTSTVMLTEKGYTGWNFIGDKEIANMKSTVAHTVELMEKDETPQPTLISEMDGMKIWKFGKFNLVVFEKETSLGVARSWVASSDEVQIKIPPLVHNSTRYLHGDNCIVMGMQEEAREIYTMQKFLVELHYNN